MFVTLLHSQRGGARYSNPAIAARSQAKKGVALPQPKKAHTYATKVGNFIKKGLHWSNIWCIINVIHIQSSIGE